MSEPSTKTTTDVGRRKPVSFALTGATLGVFFGLLGGGRAQATSWSDQILGYVLVGVVVGAMTGALLPWFRNRWIGGLIVGVALAVALGLVRPLWGWELEWPMIAFLGACYGFIFSVLLWRSMVLAPDARRGTRVE